MLCKEIIWGSLTKSPLLLLLLLSGTASQYGLWPPRTTKFLDYTQ
jgi:hypothetical protein